MVLSLHFHQTHFRIEGFLPMPDRDRLVGVESRPGLGAKYEDTDNRNNTDRKHGRENSP